MALPRKEITIFDLDLDLLGGGDGMVSHYSAIDGLREGHVFSNGDKILHIMGHPESGCWWVVVLGKDEKLYEISITSMVDPKTSTFYA